MGHEGAEWDMREQKGHEGIEWDMREQNGT